MASEFIPAFPITHDFSATIYWDRTFKDYYNKTTDIYLSEDDIKYYSLPLPRENAHIGVLVNKQLYILPQNLNNIEQCLRYQNILSQIRNNKGGKFRNMLDYAAECREWLKSYPYHQHFCSVYSFFNIDQYL